MIMLDMAPTEPQALTSPPSLTGAALAWYWVGLNRYLNTEVRLAQETSPDPSVLCGAGGPDA